MNKKKIALWVLLIPVGVIFLLVGYLLLINAGDVAPPDTSGLEIERAAVSNENNAYIYFTNAAAQLYWPTNWVPPSEIVDDPELLASVVNSNGVVFSIVKDGNACDVFQPPVGTNLSYGYPYMQPLLTLGKTLGLKCTYELHTDQLDEAIETALSLTRYGWLMQEGGCVVIEYLVGVAIQGIGLARCEEIIRAENVSARQLLALSFKLAPYTSSRRGLKLAFKGEYRLAVMATEELMAGKGAIEYFLCTQRHRILSLHQRHLIQRNRTLRLIASFYRRMIANTDLAYNEMDRSDFGDQKRSPLHFLGLFLRPNPIGRILYRLLTPATQAILGKRCEVETEVSCIRVVAACLAYERDNGQLPDSLADLVPAYIDSVPRDPWNGKALQYLPDKAIVYAVGNDLIDSGGSTVVSDPTYCARHIRLRKHAEDMVFEIHPKQAE